MSLDSTASQAAESGNEGNKRVPCPLYGCKRVYTDTTALESHIKDHEVPAQSLPGKIMLCSSVGCSGSFPNMQKLMEHMRHHHKPNIFFLCESCRTKLRSYKGLLTHLHTCSKVPRGKKKPSEATPPQSAAMTKPNLPATAPDFNPPQGTVFASQQLPFQIQNPEGSLPAAVPQPDSFAHPALGPPCLFNPDASSPHSDPPPLTEAAPQPHIRNQASNLPASLNLDSQTVSSAVPDVKGDVPQHSQTTTPELLPPAQVSAPHSPPGSAAIWKKNQGMACSRRILWEHTKGRYTCVQCGHSVSNRKEMNQHITTHHSNNKPAEDTGNLVTNT